MSESRPPEVPPAAASPAGAAAPAAPSGRPVVAAGLVVALALFAFALVSLHGRRAAVAAERDARAEGAAAGTPILIARATVGTGTRRVTLPGDVRAFRQVTLYAKVSGYLRDIRVDKGDSVAHGAIIGVLESPETDNQARQVAADLTVKRQLAQRYRGLVGRGVVSQQEMERAQADVEAAQADLARIEALRAYETVRAPFAGVITARYVDAGALLPAATGATQSAQPLVDLVDMANLRIYVYVGQAEAPYVRVGDPVQLTDDDGAAIAAGAKITRIARALDPRTRTMLAEVDIDNAAGAVYPGLFVRVALEVRAPAGLTVPADAIVVRGGKALVAVVADDVAHFRPVTLGSDDGHLVHVLSGLAEGDTVGLHVGDEISEGARVRAVAPR